MKISTRGRYGVRLMLELAQNFGRGPLTLREISRRQDISEKYLWQLVNPLKKAGIITSGRGAHGGYTLTKPPSKVTLKDIIVILEGPLYITSCAENPSLCKRSRCCPSLDIWEEIGVQIAQKLSSITLEDMLQKKDRINKGQAVAPIYYI
ncbi:MAG: Rrf2 family transcriptional regulator [Candidatus Omnitrophica bacterium]|nr:Rrf2 family transcriptional regulator [Candidatus Omnitrophota bacterium]MDD5311173.1 Rrf2 family transcriptional regulator [Candidatus Omnitrophota bacterium]MDD5547199.1 Rrf2 family transcriptional regulator [Candidatus Omnitrophota bacterium]